LIRPKIRMLFPMGTSELRRVRCISAAVQMMMSRRERAMISHSRLRFFSSPGGRSEDVWFNTVLLCAVWQRLF